MDQRQFHTEWPDDPYKGMAYYESKDRHLFAGREEEVCVCARLLASAQTRLLILHGQTGCGKSSFLRAGLIPALEENGAGYLFLRHRGAQGRWDPTFIRCGADPVAAIAEEVFEFAGHPHVVPTARGPRPIDVSMARLGFTDRAAFLEHCADPVQLCAALQQLAAAVPHTLVLVLDQAEELITMNQAPDNRWRFSIFVRELLSSSIDLRFVIAIRKDHSGPFIGSIQSDNELTVAFRTFFLNDLGAKGLREAIERPTLREMPDGSGLPGPYERYRFEYAAGLVDTIVADIVQSVPAGATLPVMQIVCRDLYEHVRRARAPWIIGREAYEQGGKIEGRIKRHVLESLGCVIAAASSRGKSTPQLELKWLRVLKQLVQEEGDGRVHTNAMRRATLQQLARDEGIEGPVDGVLSGLADPKILILRRFDVHGPDAAPDQELLCLGHDMVGIAILAAWRAADFRRAVTDMRKRSIQFAAFSILLVALLGAGGLYKVSVDTTRSISELLESARLSRNTDIVQALLIAHEARKREQGGLVSNQRPNRELAGLLSGFPDVIAGSGTAPLKLESWFYPTYALTQRKGFAMLRQDGVLEVRSLDADGKPRGWSEARLPWPRVGVDALRSLEIVDLTPKVMLASYTSRAAQAAGGVVALPDGGPPHVFSEARLVEALGDSGQAADVQLLGLGGSAIVMSRYEDRFDQMYPGALTLTPDLQPIPAAPLSQRPAPATSGTSEHYLVSYLYKDGVDAPPGSEVVRPVQGRALGRVIARNLLASEPDRSWDISELSSVRACRTVVKELCEVTLIPDLQQPGLIVMGMWKWAYSRFGQRTSGFVSHLVLAQTGAHGVIEIDLQHVAIARQQCVAGDVTPRLPVKSADTIFLHDDDLPVFVLAGPRSLQLGFATATSAQLIGISTQGLSCRELYIPRAQIDGWRGSADGETLFGLTRTGGFIWNLGQPVAAQDGAIDKRLRRLCNGVAELEKISIAAAPVDGPAPRRSLRDLCR